jgi:ParB family chromosome partitioning protein
MRFREKTLQLSGIDSADNTYRITTQTAIDDLVVSIKNTGLIHPPLLIKKKPRFLIVSGFRRIATYRQLGLPDIAARIFDTEADPLEYVKLAITDNSLQRPLNLIEISRSLNMLSLFFKDYDDLAETASALALPDNPSVIKKIIRVCHLPWTIQNSILSNTISLPMALELGKLSKHVAVDFAKLFRDLNLSLNKQREIITIVKEIALRENVSIRQLLEGEYFLAIRNDTELNKTQKSQILRWHLKQRRFPSIERAEKEFEKNVKAMRLGRDVKLIHPDNFEGTNYTLCLNFKNINELKNRRETLEKMIAHPSLRKILD